MINHYYLKKTNLIGYDERLGLCHMLVNDGKLKWVEEHE
ncbi:ABC-three component system protein [Kandleria vitulina]